MSLSSDKGNDQFTTVPPQNTPNTLTPPSHKARKASWKPADHELLLEFMWQQESSLDLLKGKLVKTSLTASKVCTPFIFVRIIFIPGPCQNRNYWRLSTHVTSSYKPDPHREQRRNYWLKTILYLLLLKSLLVSDVYLVLSLTLAQGVIVFSGWDASVYSSRKPGPSASLEAYSSLGEINYHPH